MSTPLCSDMFFRILRVITVIVFVKRGPFAHLSAEDVLKSVVIEEKKFKNIESAWPLNFDTQRCMYSFS